MGDRDLIIRSDTPPAQAISLVLSGQVTESGMARALTKHLPTEQARAVMAGLPVPMQARLVNQQIGGAIEAPLLALVPIEHASATVLLNTILFHTRSREELHMVHGEEWEDTVAELEEHLVRVTKSSGNMVEIPLFLDPDQAFVLANTILHHSDRAWRERVMQELGDDFFAVVVSAFMNGKLQLDENVWLDFWECLPDQLRGYCETLSRELPFATIASDLIGLHAQTTTAQFAVSQIPEERKAIDQIIDELVAKRSTDQLVAELEDGADEDWDDLDTPDPDVDLEGNL